MDYIGINQEVILFQLPILVELVEEGWNPHPRPLNKECMGDWVG